MPKQLVTEQVSNYFKQLEHPLKPVIEELRKIVLATDSEISEQIKWNSPSYYYSGNMKHFDPKEYKRDIVVFNLHKKDQILLVFPTGNIVDDNSGILEGKFKDTRKIAIFKTAEDVKIKASDLQAVIKKWLALAER